MTTTVDSVRITAETGEEAVEELSDLEDAERLGSDSEVVIDIDAGGV